MLVATLFAGHDTTKHQLACALHTFAEYPAHGTPSPGARSSPARHGGVIRVAPLFRRSCDVSLEDVTYRDLELPAGTLVFVCSTTAANTDPATFGEAPFDITVRRPTPADLRRWHASLRWPPPRPRRDGGGAAPPAPRVSPTCTSAGPVQSRPPTGISGPATLPLTFRRRPATTRHVRVTARALRRDPARRAGGPRRRPHRPTPCASSRWSASERSTSRNRAGRDVLRLDGARFPDHGAVTFTRARQLRSLRC